jgi:hypothetical protein
MKVVESIGETCTAFTYTEKCQVNVECDHLLVGDEVEYLSKGKSYCDDCYRAVKKSEVI